MESLPEAIVQYILSQISNARDVAVCNCVSKKWKESTPYVKCLFFPRNSFDYCSSTDSADQTIRRMVAQTAFLEKLVVYSPFSSAGLASWLSLACSSLKQLELRMDNLAEYQGGQSVSPSKLDCISTARDLESLTLWGSLMLDPPKWDIFPHLRSLEIVGAKLEDSALSAALTACPNLTKLLMRACEGVRSVSIELPHLEQCKLDFYGAGNCSLSLNCPKIEVLDVQGCSCVRVRETNFLKNLSIANSAGRVST